MVVPFTTDAHIIYGLEECMFVCRGPGNSRIAPEVEPIKNPFGRTGIRIICALCKYISETLTGSR